MGQDSNLVQLRKDLKQFQVDSIARDQQFQQLHADFEERNARQDSLEEKQDDQFAFLSAQMDKLLSSFTESQKGMEQKDRSVSFDSMKANVGSTSK
ncbi:hypothetical protein FH972_000636 [Carpinus fangiana]|uniref:Uncharacterized protein n=1 Tax=Carpinus fangiana TaxID=176857 RepID=A0A5N6QCE5_9ROSI|nr:hypothetical protein FH972_000636 [Carpinus fangiana]